MKSQTLLEINNLNLSLGSINPVHILHDISFSLNHGEVLGMVGESGCGKSMTANAILQLLPTYANLSGEIQFFGKNLLELNSNELGSIRGNAIGLILQDPALSLNPIMKVGKQLTDILRYHKKMSSKSAHEMAALWLHRVGLTDVPLRMQQYPHEMSGGMKQRILIAIALICKPALLIADEPTTALDVTTQALVLDLLKKLQKEESMALILITHDLGIVANYCEKVAVMYAGRIIEMGHVKTVLSQPKHPYTKALITSQIHPKQPHSSPLQVLEGQPPSFHTVSSGCPFLRRCSYKIPPCEKAIPPKQMYDCHEVCCWLEKEML